MRAINCQKEIGTAFPHQETLKGLILLFSAKTKKDLNGGINKYTEIAKISAFE